MPPRLLRPKDEPGAPDDYDLGADLRSSKRRAVSSACIPCRKRKSKCDGAQPSCSTCTAVYRTECAYDADSDHRRKGALKRDIQSLQQQNDALDVIVASLRSLPEDEAVALLHSLRGDSDPDVLAAALKNNVRLPYNFAPQTLEADVAQQMSQSTPSSSSYDTQPFATASSREHSADDNQIMADRRDGVDSPAVWFRTPQDGEFVEHLLNLYLAWVHPFYHMFSTDHFLHAMARGRGNFCSAMLVNALMASACHYSDRPQARTDPNNPATAGDQFFAEAKRILDRNEKSSLTTVQALGIMGARECSAGRDANGYKYAGMCVRMALELGLHLSLVGSGLRSTDVQVRQITFWGVFNLETICSISVGRLSQLPRAAADIQKPSCDERSEASTWKPYVDANLALSPSMTQMSQPVLFTNTLSQLSELASDMVNTFYAPQERFTSRRLAATYAQYQRWYGDLPSVFRLENSSLPHVLVLHMYYFSCVLQLFRPYIKLDLQSAGLYPRDTCTVCANEISGLMNALRAMYGLRRVALAVASIILSSSTIHLLNLPSEPAAMHLSQGMRDLQALSVNHHFAAKCVDIIRALATKWNITLPDGAVNTPVFRERWQSTQSTTFFAASIERNASSENSKRSSEPGNNQGPFAPPDGAPPQQQHERSSAFFHDQITPMETGQADMAFWTPFPIQGAPLQPQEWPGGMSNSFSSGHAGQQWPVFGGYSGSTTCSAGMPPTPAPATDEGVDGAMVDWSWT